MAILIISQNSGQVSVRPVPHQCQLFIICIPLELL
nr:MAG TPA: hypothetical protein [Caudoviricetes sp.]